MLLLAASIYKGIVLVTASERMLEANSFLALFILIPNLGIVVCRTLSKVQPRADLYCWSILRVSPLILGGDNSLVRQPFVLPLHPQLCRVQASVAVLKLYLPYTLGRVSERRLGMWRHLF